MRIRGWDFVVRGISEWTEEFAATIWRRRPLTPSLAGREPSPAGAHWCGVSVHLPPAVDILAGAARVAFVVRTAPD